MFFFILVNFLNLYFEIRLRKCLIFKTFIIFYLTSATFPRWPVANSWWCWFHSFWRWSVLENKIPWKKKVQVLKILAHCLYAEHYCSLKQSKFAPECQNLLSWRQSQSLFELQNSKNFKILAFFLWTLHKNA